jgi:hypothetical protein
MQMPQPWGCAHVPAACSGQTFERKQIERWLGHSRTCPVTRECRQPCRVLIYFRYAAGSYLGVATAAAVLVSHVLLAACFATAGDAVEEGARLVPALIVKRLVDAVRWKHVVGDDGHVWLAAPSP